MPTLDQRIELLKATPHDPACIEVIDALLRKLHDIQRRTTDLVVQAFLSKDVPEKEKRKLLDAGWEAVVRSCTEIEE